MATLEVGAAPDALHILPLSEADIGHAAELITETFQHEAITRYGLRLHDPVARRHHSQLLRARLRLYDAPRQTVFIAKQGAAVIGVAVLEQAEAGRLPWRRMLRLLLPLSPRVFAMLLRVNWSILLQASALRRALQPPESPQPHQLLEVLAVHPRYQGQGVGRQLLTAVHARAQDLDLQGTRLLTGDEKNWHIYQRYGYTTLRHDQLGGLDIWHMFRPSHS